MPQRVTLLMILLALAELVVIFLMVSPERLNHAREKENQVAIQLFGRELARDASEFAARNFDRHFVQSGFVEVTEGLVIPNEEQRARTPELQPFRESLPFEWARTRVDALWIIIYGAYHRAYVIALCALFAMAIIICCLVDALVQRRINITNSKISNSVFYHSAKKLLVFLIVAPLFLAIAPITLTPLILVAWILLLPPAIWIGARNVQEI